MSRLVFFFSTTKILGQSQKLWQSPSNAKTKRRPGILYKWSGAAAQKRSVITHMKIHSGFPTPPTLLALKLQIDKITQLLASFRKRNKRSGYQKTLLVLLVSSQHRKKLSRSSYNLKRHVYEHKQAVKGHCAVEHSEGISANQIWEQVCWRWNYNVYKIVFLILYCYYYCYYLY